MIRSSDLHLGFFTDPAEMVRRAHGILDVEAPPAATGTGLASEYYNTMDLSGAIALNRVEPQVNICWGYGSPSAAVNTNYFSARWTGSF